MGPVRIQQEYGDAFLLVFGAPPARSRDVDEKDEFSDITTEVTRLHAELKAETAGTDGLDKAAIAARLQGDHCAQVFIIRRRLGSTVSFVSLGRAAELDLQVRDPSVSRFHAHFREEPGGVRVRDASSSNGTFVGEAHVADVGTLLKPGDKLTFGGIKAAFHDAASFCGAIKAL